jgi:hypothetical protein
VYKSAESFKASAGVTVGVVGVVVVGGFKFSADKSFFLQEDKNPPTSPRKSGSS